MTKPTAMPTQPAPEGTAPPSAALADARKPWHAPNLTEVALQVTSVGSGQTQDNDGSSTLN